MLVWYRLPCPGMLLTSRVPAVLINACWTAQALLHASDALKLHWRALAFRFLPFTCAVLRIRLAGFCMQVFMCIGNRWLSRPCLFLVEGVRLCLQGLYETGAEVCEWDPEVCLLRRLEAWPARTCAQYPCGLLQCMFTMRVGPLGGWGSARPRTQGGTRAWRCSARWLNCEAQAWSHWRCRCPGQRLEVREFASHHAHAKAMTGRAPLIQLG